MQQSSGTSYMVRRIFTDKIVSVFLDNDARSRRHPVQPVVTLRIQCAAVHEVVVPQGDVAWSEVEGVQQAGTDRREQER